MKGIVCECGCSKWRVKYVRARSGLRRRRLQCRDCGRMIFTEEKREVSESSYTRVTTPEKADSNNSKDC